MNIDTYLTHLQAFFEAQKNAEIAQYQKQYLRNQFEFLGIKTPLLRQTLKAFLLEHKLPQSADLEVVIKRIYALTEREYHHIAIEMLGSFRKKFAETDLELLEYLIIHHAWWDTVDALAHLVGDYFKLFPHHKLAYCHKWLGSGNFWLQRVAIIFQIAYKAQTDSDLLFQNILQVADSQEFFIRKAIGWALREYSKSQPELVRAFVNQHQDRLSALSKYEALRRIT